MAASLIDQKKYYLKEIMRTYYQKTNSPSAFNGIIAVSMSDETRKQLELKADFLDEKSKEVQAYLAAQTELLATQQDAKDLADAKAQALDEVIGKRVTELHKAKRKAERQSEAKLAEG